MRFRPANIGLRIHLLLGSACLLACASPPAAAQELVEREGGAVHASPLSLGRRVMGASECRRCHFEKSASADDPLADAFPGGASHDGWLRMNEQRIWFEQDKHAQAFTSLKNERSKRMSELLYTPEQRSRGSAVHRDARCLACHASLPMQEVELAGYQVPEALEDDPRVALGVSCEACHGAAGSLDERSGWLDPHSARDASQKWRFLDAAEKQERFGFYDLRTPTSRARACLSCHVGSAREGRVVTHEMYAAGHPPLPGFEIASFVRQLPPHWRTFEEKPAALRAEFLRQTGQEAPQHGAEKVRSVAVSVATAWSEQLQLAADLAEDHVAAPAHGTVWPELSQFECYACHHELRASGWRAERHPPAAPGRPLLRFWPTPLLRAVLTAGDGSADGLDVHLEELTQLSAARPFGASPERLVPALRAAADWTEEQAKIVEAREFSSQDGVALFREILRAGSTETLDYDSACQLVFALDAIVRALDPEGKSKSIAQLRETRDELAKMFVLDLRGDGAVDPATHLIPGATRSRDVYEISLAGRMPRIAAYDAGQFRAAMQRMAAKLAR